MSGKKIQQKSVKYYLREIEKIHPYKSFVYLYFVISALILGFVVFSLELKKVTFFNSISEIVFPDIFILGAFLLFSTLLFTTHQTRLYKSENVNRLKSSFYLQLFISTLFIVIQMMAVYQFRLMTEGMIPGPLVSYFIVLISFHLIHLILAIVIMIILMFRLINVLEDPVKTLVYVTNPFEKLLLEIKQLFWNYQVIVWILIFLYLELRF